MLTPGARKGTRITEAGAVSLAVGKRLSGDTPGSPHALPGIESIQVLAD